MSELTYKKIIDVDVVETLNDAATVFINDNGAMKQVAVNEFGLGTVKTVNGIVPDENGDIKSDIAFPVLITHMKFPMFDDIKCNKTCQELHNGLLTQSTDASSIALLLYTAEPKSEVYYYCENFLVDKNGQDGGVRFILNFGKEIRPYIVDVNANTITLDADWVAPAACVKTVNGVEPDENGAIESYHSVSFNFADGSAIVPGLINYYGAETMAELCDYYAKSGMYNVECRRMIMTSDNRVQFRTCIGNEAIKDADGNITGQRLFFGDDLCPVILDIASNKIIFDPDWVAPEANITESAANTLVDTKVAELSTTVDTKLSELAAQELSLPKSAGVVDHGTTGQFAVSDGMGGIMWKTLVEAEEVAY